MKREKNILLPLLLLGLACTAAFPADAFAYTASSEEEDLDKLRLIAENEGTALYLDEKTATLRLVDLESGIAVDTKLMDGDSGNDNIKANQKSDFIISYWDNSNKSKGQTSTTTTQTNYTMAVANEQMEYTEIENGLRVTYQMREDKMSMDCVPKYISEERMNELVLAYVTSEQRTWLQDYYRLYNGFYTRTKDDGSVTQSVIRTLYEIFYETGTYTAEDLEADNLAYDYESKWNNLEITVSLDYILDGDDLVVRFPTEDLLINKEGIIVNTISLLPYFMSSTTEEEGCMVVPDGSGAVINFNNGLTTATDYVSRVYGKDVLIGTETADLTEYYASMPVIGMVYEDYALLGIVEQGDALAEINTKISGKVDNYNNAYFKFYITEMENVATSSSSSVSVNKYTGDTYTGDIVLRFKLLTDKDDVSYVGLARTYQEYLVERGILTRREDMSPSLVVELFGSDLESKTMLGIPYNGVKSLTSFKEAEEILNELSALGVDQATIQMDGWLDGGSRHELLNSCGLESEQGSKGDFTSLTETAAKLGYALYPDIELQMLNPSFDFMQGGAAKSYAKKYGSRFLSNEYALLKSAMIGLTENEGWIWNPYYLSPSNLLSYTQKAAKNLSGYSLPGYTVTDLGTMLIADYNEKAPVSRQNASVKVAEALAELGKDKEIALTSPYQYAWKGVSVMTDIPSRSNEYTVFSYDIPFLQLVLNGCVSYSTEPVNNHPEKSMEEQLLTCIETGSNPKFYLMASDMEELQYLNDTDNQYMSIRFEDWKEKAVSLYQEYCAFSEQVKGSTVISHERLSEKVVRVGYDNGLAVYLNYSDKETTVGKQKLAGMSYLVVKEG